MHYRITNTNTPCTTCTAPYFIQRKRRIFGWKYIGRARSKQEAQEIISADMDDLGKAHKLHDGEWAWIVSP
jgi:hypothetical protein